MRSQNRKYLMRVAGVGAVIFMIAFVTGLAYVIAVAILTILAD